MPEDQWRIEARREMLDEIVSALRNDNVWIEESHNTFADWVEQRFSRESPDA